VSDVITNDKWKCTMALEALKDVTDPEIGLNIVDLGLIYQLDFDKAEKKLYCIMTLTTRFCPMGESITDAVKEVLLSVFPGYEILLEVTFEPSWNYAMISEEGQNFLKR
jgi:metal-sulfur cluster biosynthetic enzyme